jgi:hypothetical protein
MLLVDEETSAMPHPALPPPPVRSGGRAPTSLREQRRLTTEICAEAYDLVLDQAIEARRGVREQLAVIVETALGLRPPEHLAATTRLASSAVEVTDAADMPTGGRPLARETAGVA